MAPFTPRLGKLAADNRRQVALGSCVDTQQQCSCLPTKQCKTLGQHNAMELHTLAKREDYSSHCLCGRNVKTREFVNAMV